MFTRICAALVCVPMLLAGCAGMSDTQRHAATGAAIGTAAGAAIGAATAGGNRSRSAGTGAAIGAVAGAAGGYIWSRRMEEQKRTMEQATAGTGIAVSQTPDNQLKLDVPSDVSFDTGRADIRANFRPVLDRFAQSLASNPATTVRIVGHTDSTGTDTVNYPLSINRAASTRDYLVGRGVNANRIAIDGRSAREPVSSNGTDAGRARNRRVEIYVGEQVALAR